MKKSFPLKLEALALYFLVFCAVAAAMIHLQIDFETQNNLTAKRLAHVIIPLIAKAHHDKDDLALQEAVAALAQAPGVSLAYVADKEEKVLAHNRLSQIGKTAELPSRSDGIHAFPLKEGTARWGALVFSLSEAGTHRQWTQWVFIFAGCGIFLCVGYSVRLGIEGRRLYTVRQAVRDQTALLDEERHKTGRLEQDLTNRQRQSRLWFHSALERIPEAVLLLDGRQRIAAFNTEAGRLLGLNQKEEWVNKSWQDVPWLQDQGLALERSLRIPDTDVLSEDGQKSGLFRTEEQWTWVKPRPVLRVCP